MKRTMEELSLDLPARYAEVGQWFQTNGPRILESQQLQGPQTATTVRFDHAGQPAITDGPFIESNEIVGGYATIDVADLDDPGFPIAEIAADGSSVIGKHDGTGGVVSTGTAMILLSRER